MEYVAGTTLKELIQTRGLLPMSVRVTVGKQLCRALEVAHEAGVVHRHIKPHNLLLDAGGFLKVMDFGIARLLEGGRPGEGLTAAGTAIGTVEYMAPEQLLGEAVDQRTDLCAVGCVLYECLTGRTVFPAATVTSLMVKHLGEEPRDPRLLNLQIPDSLAAVVLKALAKKPEGRWQSAEELHRALEGVTEESGRGVVLQ